MGQNRVRGSEEVYKIGKEIVPHRLTIIMKVRCCIVVFIIKCHSCFLCQNFCYHYYNFSVFFTFFLAIKENNFSNYSQYLLDYPSASEDDDSDFVVEEPDETQENDSHVIDSDMVLSSSENLL
jgi:hypothetical protein